MKLFFFKGKKGKTRQVFFLGCRSLRSWNQTPLKDHSGSRNNINAEQLVANGHSDGKNMETVYVCVRARAGIICRRADRGVIFSTYSDCFPALLLWCPTLLFSLPVYFRQTVPLYCSAPALLFFGWVSEQERIRPSHLAARRCVNTALLPSAPLFLTSVSSFSSFPSSFCLFFSFPSSFPSSFPLLYILFPLSSLPFLPVSSLFKLSLLHLLLFKMTLSPSFLLPSSAHSSLLSLPPHIYFTSFSYFLFSSSTFFMCLIFLPPSPPLFLYFHHPYSHLSP